MTDEQQPTEQSTPPQPVEQSAPQPSTQPTAPQQPMQLAQPMRTFGAGSRDNRGQRSRRGPGGRSGGGRRGDRHDRRDEEFEQSLIDLARVTRVMRGGKRMRFRACIVLGDKKGRVGFGLMKGNDVQAAIAKAVTRAKKQLIRVPLVNGTIPHEVQVRSSSAHVLLKPAPKGHGIIAGGAIRPVLELAGVENIVAKMLGSNSKINNVQATILALQQLKTKEFYKKLAGKKSKAVATDATPEEVATPETPTSESAN